MSLIRLNKGVPLYLDTELYLNNTQFQIAVSASSRAVFQPEASVFQSAYRCEPPPNNLSIVHPTVIR